MSTNAITPEPMVLPVQQMDGAEHEQFEPQPYLCGSEWHLARLGGICTLLHPFALRISHDSGVFSCSAVSVGRYFNCDESTVRRGFEKLEKAEFFEKVMQGTFGPSHYRVFSHDKWAEKHPNQCPVKFDYGWDGDPLGRKLWAKSGTRVKFLEFQVRELRSLGIPDDQIVDEFEAYYQTEGQRKKPRNVACGFYLHLKRLLKVTGQTVQ